MELIFVLFAFVLAVVMVAAQFQLFAIRRLLEEIARRDRVVAMAAVSDSLRRTLPLESVGGEINWPGLLAVVVPVFIVVIIIIAVTWK